ncbi:MAG: YhcH/YjgK/YiaL family protein [Kiritimatiellales bacterium]|nr:YhcH/YjgK/YiaL family protein [Kiritimatiellales bacterium]
MSMILDTLQNAVKYTGMSSSLSDAFGFLEQPGLSDLEDGRHAIAGDRIYAIVAHENGRPAEEALLEGHRKYIDVQYVISGDESMGWCPREGLKNATDYDADKDLEFFEGEPESMVHVPPGSFVVFMPTDAHLPLIGNGPIHKVVVKVAVG